MFRAVLPSLPAVFITSLLVSQTALSQCEFHWNPGQPLAGVSSPVRTSIVHDDGAGPKLYIGGYFTRVVDTYAHSFAAFDGKSWSAVGDLGYGPVYALAEFEGDLYVGGHLHRGFWDDSVLRWDGQTWFRTPGELLGTVFALTVHDGALFAGGDMWDIYRWDGTSWTLIPGLAGRPVYALASYGGQLIAAGNIGIEGQETRENIAAWDGADWRSLGGGLDSYALVLHSHQGELFVGGPFQRAGELDVTGVARWNGQTWLPLGNNLDARAPGSLRAFAAVGADVYAAGSFQMPSEPNTRQMVARWDRIEWTGIAKSTGTGYTLSTYDGHLYAGGGFGGLGGVAARHLASWDGNAWHRISPGVVSGARSAVTFAGQVFIGSLVAAFDGVEIRGIARFDGQAWHDASEGVSSNISCLAVVDDRLIAAWNDATASGYRLSAWNGAVWEPLPGLFDQPVNALILYGGQLVAGGEFLAIDGEQRKRIARFDGSAWQSVGLGVGRADSDESIRALAEFQGVLVAGGAFTVAGGNVAHGLAHWNGIIWTELGGGVGGPVYALAVRDDWLYMGGYFGTAGPIYANHIARWDGQTWQALGAGIEPGWIERAQVQTMQFVGQSLYVGGSFIFAGDEVAQGVARWDGAAWNRIDGGFPDPRFAGVSGIALLGNRLFFAGGFMRAGNQMSVAFASLDLPALVADLDQDGDCDLQDLATLLSGFGTESGPGDLDGDGDTDVQDLSILLADFAVICP